MKSIESWWNDSKAQDNLTGTIFFRGGDGNMARERLVVIGGDAAGMSAASQARRQRPDMEIIAFERGPHTSYAA
jgi:hypothetical protein